MILLLILSIPVAAFAAATGALIHRGVAGLRWLATD